MGASDGILYTMSAATGSAFTALVGSTRQTYAARGPVQAARFSWARTAQQTRAVYDAVLGVRRSAALTGTDG